MRFAALKRREQKETGKEVSFAERKRSEDGDREKKKDRGRRRRKEKRKVENEKKEKETKIWECNTEKKGKRLREKKGKK
jgi:hypothetical protein